jgi:hypothetical protein
MPAPDIYEAERILITRLAEVVRNGLVDVQVGQLTRNAPAVRGVNALRLCIPR